MAIEFGQPISFGRRGIVRQLKCRGIDLDEALDQSWTTEPVAEIELVLPFVRKGLAIEIAGTPFTVPGKISSQQLFVFINGLFAGFVLMTAFKTQRFSLSGSTVPFRETRLTLVMPTAVSPASLQPSSDLRELGICLSSLTFEAVD